MKTILILAIGLFAVSASARVGTKTFSHSVSAETETLVMNKVERTIPLIVSGKIKSPFQTGASCWPNNSRTIKVRSVDVKKSYKTDSYGNLTSYFTASINYVHRKCREDR
jgi:hypothetical protein